MIFCLFKIFTNIILTSRFNDASQSTMSNADTAQEMSELSWFKYFQVVFTCSGLLSVKIISPQKFFFPKPPEHFLFSFNKGTFWCFDLVRYGFVREMVPSSDWDWIVFSLLHVDFFQRSKQNDNDHNCSILR